MSKVWTGERLETFIFNDNTVEHLHRYALAAAICKDADVLDIASGEGYGSNLLAQISKTVTGVDISSDTVAEASRKYKKNNLLFKEGSASQIPVESNSVDVVVSFETIEHHDKHLEMLREIKRVLRTGGVLIMSSPDKKYYTDERKYTNPFHVKELYFDEFKQVINSHFTHTGFYAQNIVHGSLILPENSSQGFFEFSGDYETIRSKEEFSPLYNVCIASDGKLPNIPITLFDGRHISEQVTAHAIDKAVNRIISMYEASWSYRIGRLLSSPLRMIKKH